MLKSIDVSEFQQHVESVLDDVRRQHASYILAQGGRPKAALIPYDDFRAFQQMRVQAMLERVGRLEANLASLDPDQPEWTAELAATEADSVAPGLARLAARRVLNARLPWTDEDSTEVLRQLRNGTFDE